MVNVSLSPENKLPIVNNISPNNVIYIILVRSNNSPTIGFAITIAIKYTANINEIDDVTFKSFFIVGNAKETIEVSIADINIININAIIMPNDFIFIYNFLTLKFCNNINIYLTIIYL